MKEHYTIFGERMSPEQIKKLISSPSLKQRPKDDNSSPTNDDISQSDDTKED